MTDYLTVIEVLAIHADQIDRYGGAQGVRDRGLLEAALYRPQTGYYADLIEEAAALWESLAQNHPFIDGNKRTAFAALFMFLALNGMAFEPTEVDATLTILQMAAGEMTDEEFTAWVRLHAQAPAGAAG